jgi:hypothetical protein
MSRPPYGSGLGKLQPSDWTGWLTAIQCLDVGSLTVIPPGPTAPNQTALNRIPA